LPPWGLLSLTPARYSLGRLGGLLRLVFRCRGLFAKARLGWSGLFLRRSHNRLRLLGTQSG
jgi:hypothetical protein